MTMTIHDRLVDLPSGEVTDENLGTLMKHVAKMTREASLKVDKRAEPNFDPEADVVAAILKRAMTSEYETASMVLSDVTAEVGKAFIPLLASLTTTNVDHDDRHEAYHKLTTMAAKAFEAVLDNNCKVALKLLTPVKDEEMGHA